MQQKQRPRIKVANPVCCCRFLGPESLLRFQYTNVCMRWAKRSTRPTLLTVIVCKVARCHVSNAKIVDFGANQPKLEHPFVKFRGYHSRARSVCAQATEIQEVRIRKHIKVSSFCIKTLTSLRSKRFSVS